MKKYKAIIAEIVHALCVSPHDFRGIYQLIDDLAQANEMDALYAIGCALEELDRTEPVFQHADGVFDHILQKVAFMPGIDSVELLFQLALVKCRTLKSDQEEWSSWNANLAWMLIAGQPETALLPILDRYNHEEGLFPLLGFLVYEMVLYEWDVEKHGSVQVLHQKMKEQHLPLIWLPLHLTTIETDFPSLTEAECNILSKPCAGTLHPPKQKPSLFRETTTEHRRTKIQAAVSGQLEESNGRCEARTFEADASVFEPSTFPQALVSLPLRSFDKEETEVFLYKITPEEAFAALLSTSIYGGAYGGGRKGARGRLETWISLAGFVEASDEETVEQVEQRVQACEWFYFSSSAWFCNRAWDLGIVAIDPQQQFLAILAATDTD